MFACGKLLFCVLQYGKQNFIGVQLGACCEKARG